MPHSYSGAQLPEAKRLEIWRYHLDGMNYRWIGRHLGVHEKVVSAVCRGMKNSSGGEWERARIEAGSPDPRVRAELSREAKRALRDFGYFRARYFGRVATPWQEEAAYKVQAMLKTREKEHAVVNAPPSVGKSTLFTHDIPAWLACRDRKIRCLIGSRTFRQARWYTGRLRRSFERTETLPPDEEEVEAGRAVKPESSLVRDFGRFRPQTEFTTDIWRAEEFVIAQPGNVSISEKEASFAAYGMDSGFLGGRFKLVIWDDLVDRKNIRNAEALAALIETYEDEAETRLEPGGLLILQGQRMAANDLYRHALDQKAGELDEGEEDEEDVPLVDDRPAKYHHIVYKAHYEDVCKGRETHRLTAPAWQPLGDGSSDPEGGCLLDPRRLTWRDLRTIRANREQKFRVLYQQEDVDPASVLVPKLWVDGGTDPVTKESFPGCWDNNRGLADPPKGLSPPVLSIVTADPSPTKFWAVAWWLVHPASEQVFLLDLARKAMDAPDFLDWDYATGRFVGLAEEWQLRSIDLGVPITHWVVEANAAQRFILQYDHARRWQSHHRLSVLAHQTQRHNKESDEYGIQSIAPWFRSGRVRLPGRQAPSNARVASLKLVDEVTRYPEGQTDDCVMATWFLIWNLPRLAPSTIEVPAQRRPTWLGSSRGALRAIS